MNSWFSHLKIQEDFQINVSKFCYKFKIDEWWPEQDLVFDSSHCWWQWLLAKSRLLFSCFKMCLPIMLLWSLHDLIYNWSVSVARKQNTEKKLTNLTFLTSSELYLREATWFYHVHLIQQHLSLLTPLLTTSQHRKANRFA